MGRKVTNFSSKSDDKLNRDTMNSPQCWELLTKGCDVIALHFSVLVLATFSGSTVKYSNVLVLHMLLYSPTRSRNVLTYPLIDSVNHFPLKKNNMHCEKYYTNMFQLI